MTDPTPAERAAEPAHMAYMYTACTNDHHVVWPAIAEAVFESIDTDELADVLTEARYRSGTYSSQTNANSGPVGVRHPRRGTQK